MAPSFSIKRILKAIVPSAQKDDTDGRDAWPSRAAFILASCGGAVGMGNILRFPSQVFNNYGLQWFVPYLLAVFLIAIPTLMLEIAIGQAYRGGSVIAYNNMSHRLKGTGMSLVFVGFVVVSYFVPILGWVMAYFRGSFYNPLPWSGQEDTYFMQQVVRNPEPDMSGSWVSYPTGGMVAETTGWTIFTWFIVWLCSFNGVGLTGRVVYFTMGLPVVTVIILLGRSVSLPNASDGIKLYFGTWRSSLLADGQIWQTAVGQVFFSTGVGFGYYTAYASYNTKFSNAVQDAFIIVTFNCTFEVVAAFAVFGVIGNIGWVPEEIGEIGSFDIGFLTYPVALAQMPVSNLWSLLFFFTLMLLGISSSFAMLDGVTTLIMDCDFAGKSKWTSRPVIATTLTVLTMILSLMYCSELGYWLLDGVDRWINNISLVFVVWAECVTSMMVYRHYDVENQVGKIAYYTYNGFYLLAQILGVAVGHAVMPAAGAGVGFGLFVLGNILAVALASTPEANAPKFFNKNTILSRLYFLSFYSGNQLRHDLNQVVGAGKNWNLPVWWGPLLRYINAPILAIIFSFAYPMFAEVSRDPVYVFGFALSHLAIVSVVGGFFLQRWFDVFIPPHRRDEGHKHYTTNVLMGADETTGQNSIVVTSEEDSKRQSDEVKKV